MAVSTAILARRCPTLLARNLWGWTSRISNTRRLPRTWAARVKVSSETAVFCGSIGQPSDRRLSYKAFGAHSNFIHHFYEFLLGAYCREREESGLTKKKGTYCSNSLFEG
jgi:hypothetical protein